MKKLPHGWKLKEFYGDGTLIAVSPDEAFTAWIEEDGDVAIGDQDGVAHGYVPFDVVEALRKQND